MGSTFYSIGKVLCLTNMTGRKASNECHVSAWGIVKLLVYAVGGRLSELPYPVPSRMAEGPFTWPALLCSSPAYLTEAILDFSLSL